MLRTFIPALVLQLAAQQFGGVWGAAVAGIVTGVMLRSGRAGRTAALSAAIAAGGLLLIPILRGAPLVAFADMVGKNFAIPGWAVVIATLVLPALQAGGLAAAISRLLRPSTSNPLTTT